MNVQWADVRAIRFIEKLRAWTILIRTPGARTYRRLTAPTYPEALVLYLGHSFDRESLLAAATIAEPRDRMQRKAKTAIDYNPNES